MLYFRQLIGITTRADVHCKLEKRVLSRLHAQYVYLSEPSPGTVCQYLYDTLMLPDPSRRRKKRRAHNTSDCTSPTTTTAAVGGGDLGDQYVYTNFDSDNDGDGEGARKGLMISREHRLAHNAHVRKLFGSYQRNRSASSSTPLQVVTRSAERSSSFSPQIVAANSAPSELATALQSVCNDLQPGGSNSGEGGPHDSSRRAPACDEIHNQKRTTDAQKERKYVEDAANDNEDNSDREENDCDADFVPGAALAFIEQHTHWGVGMRGFKQVATNLTALLSQVNPHFTAAMMATATMSLVRPCRWFVFIPCYHRIVLVTDSRCS